MALRDKDIENLLENELSDEDDLPNDECSEVESNIDEQEVVEEDCGSDSEIDGEDDLASSEKGQTQKTESRLKFLKKLAEQLTRPHMERRENNPQMQRHIKIALRRILHHKDEATQQRFQVAAMLKKG
ncbi:unnamed protein product [Parnassius apollo]|uniref:(apollo) hypothetical protein n=1 Tax=Parnassius apollo TaxID=110799 RepID=A0A8S3W7D5_PARAO|nr:unnamed protein product [Parnassius apollo]